MTLMRKKAAVSRECVACGTCLYKCPANAIYVHRGIRAVVNTAKCIGCGKCTSICPADVIKLREAEICEEAVV